MASLKSKQHEPHFTPDAVPKLGESGEATELSAKDRVDVCWRVVQRFDSYIAATNTKAALLITFNTFVIGAVLLKWSEMGQYFGPYPASIGFANFFLSLVCGAAVVSLWSSLSAVNPLLKSPKEPQTYHSMLFFGHVAEHSAPKGYVDAVGQATFESLTNDLGHQAHALAKILNCKFGWLQVATRAILFAQLPSFVGMLVTLLVASLCLHFGEGR